MADTNSRQPRGDAGSSVAAQKAAGQHGQFGELDRADNASLSLERPGAAPNPAAKASALRAAYESAATAVFDAYGELWPTDRDGIPQVFEVDSHDPSTLRLICDDEADIDPAEAAQFAADDINEYFGPQDHADGYEGDVVTATVDPHDRRLVHLTVAARQRATYNGVEVVDLVAALRKSVEDAKARRLAAGR